VNILETSLLEENVSSIGKVVSDSGNSTEKVGSWSQMSNFSQILNSMSLLGKWVLSSITCTENDGSMLIWLTQLQFEWLSLCWTLDKGTSELQTSTYIALHDVLESFYLLEDYNLHSLLISTIYQFYEAEVLSSGSGSSSPSCYSNDMVHILLSL